MRMMGFENWSIQTLLEEKTADERAAEVHGGLEWGVISGELVRW